MAKKKPYARNEFRVQENIIEDGKRYVLIAQKMKYLKKLGGRPVCVAIYENPETKEKIQKLYNYTRLYEKVMVLYDPNSGYRKVKFKKQSKKFTDKRRNFMPKRRIENTKIITILTLYDTGMSKSQIAKTVGVSTGTVDNIIKNRTEYESFAERTLANIEEIKQRIIKKYYSFAEMALDHSTKTLEKLNAYQSIIASKIAIDSIRLLTNNNQNNNSITIAIQNAYVTAKQLDEDNRNNDNNVIDI